VRSSAQCLGREQWTQFVLVGTGLRNGVMELEASCERQSSGVDVSRRDSMVYDSTAVELGASPVVEVVEDLADDGGVDDESENPCPTAGAAQRVDLVDAVDELGPPIAHRGRQARELASNDGQSFRDAARIELPACFLQSSSGRFESGMPLPFNCRV
jgi:hypothetical protein